jgi:hypothetical protein
MPERVTTVMAAVAIITNQLARIDGLANRATIVKSESADITAVWLGIAKS